MSFDLSGGLCFNRVCRRFGRRKSSSRSALAHNSLALDSLSLEIVVGGTTCLVGPNGAGKSTALALAAGLLPTSSGEIRFAGQRVTPRQPIARFGYLPQQSSFPRSLLVREVLDFAVAARRTSPRARDEVIELGDLSPALEQGIGTLSSGWLRRLGLALALLEPIDLVLLDEPFVGLDLATLERALGLLIRRAATGTTVLMCSHDFEVVDRLAPEIAVLENGRLLEVAAPGEHGAAGGARAIYQRALGGEASRRTESACGRGELGRYPDGSQEVSGAPGG